MKNCPKCGDPCFRVVRSDVGKLTELRWSCGVCSHNSEATLADWTDHGMTKEEWLEFVADQHTVWRKEHGKE